MAEQSSTDPGHIFISYRRDDSIAHVNGLFLLLREHFGKNRVFKDTDNIPPGRDFRKVIETQLQSCSVLLAVIGKNWLSAQKSKSNTRRLDDPNDYLRIEVSKALKDEGVLVIPLLVGQAVMPSADELPDDLAQLSYLNAFELRDSRWESDIRLLIQALEGAELQPRQAPDPSVLPPYTSVENPPVQEESPPVATADDGFDLLELRRKRQIAEHLKTAHEAFAALDYEVAVEACEKAIWLDAQNTEARDLRQRARAALDEQKIANWLTQAHAIMTRPVVEDGDLTLASGLVDQALALRPAHALAVQRRQELLAIRKQRERQREIDRQGRAALARAQASFDEEDFDAALGYCDDALLLTSESAAARDLREKVVAAKAEQQLQRGLKRRSRQAAEEAERAEQKTAAEGTLHAEAKAREEQAAAEEKLRAEANARAEKAAVEEQVRAEAEARAAEAAVVAEKLRREAKAREEKAAAEAEAQKAAEDQLAPDREWAAAVEISATTAPSPSDLPTPQLALRARFTPSRVAAAALVLIAVVAVVLWNQVGGSQPDVNEQRPTAASAIAEQPTGGGSPTAQPAPAPDVPGPAEPPSSEKETPDAVTRRENPAGDSVVAEQLAAVRQRAQAQYKAGQGPQALETSMAGLKLDPNDPDLLGTMTALRRDAESTLQKAKKDAAATEARSRAVAQWKQATQKEVEAAGLGNSNRPDEAIRSLWAAADGFAKAAERARQIASQLNAIAARARSELQSGQQTEALDTTLEGLRLDPAFAPLQDVVAALWRDAETAVEGSKQEASERGRSVTSSPEYQEALRRETEAARLRSEKNFGAAVKSLWAADELFAKATEHAPAARPPAKPAASPPSAAEPVSTQAQRFQSEILISSLATLPRDITADKSAIEHKSEVARGGPVAVVVWTSGCQKETGGSCKVQADLVVYAPDGAVYHEVRNLELPQGGGAAPLKLDARAPTGVYRVVVLIRDLVSRRFVKLERQFGVR